MVFTDDYGNEYQVNAPESEGNDPAPRPSRTGLLTPKEIQSRIRSGESLDSVANAAGAERDVIERYAGPILDEMDYVLDTALNIRLIAISDENNPAPETFGAVIEDRVRRYSDAPLHWLSWKDLITGSWVIQLIVDDTRNPEDGRWFYDVKHKHLSPANEFAELLSSAPDESRESRQVLFTPTAEIADLPQRDGSDEKHKISAKDTMPHNEPVEYGRSGGAIITQLYQPAQESAHPAGTNKTDELLEALRKNRGERQPAQYGTDDDDTADSTSAPVSEVVRIQYRTADIDLPLESEDFAEPVSSGFESLEIDLDLSQHAPVKANTEVDDEPLFADDDELPGQSGDFADDDDIGSDAGAVADSAADRSAETGAQPDQKPAVNRTKKGRQAVPSWDEIIFGTKTD